MALSMMYGIPQIISFKWYTMCGPVQDLRNLLTAEKWPEN